MCRVFGVGMNLGILDGSQGLLLSEHRHCRAQTRQSVGTMSKWLEKLLPAKVTVSHGSHILTSYFLTSEHISRIHSHFVPETDSTIPLLHYKVDANPFP